MGRIYSACLAKIMKTIIPLFVVFRRMLDYRLVKTLVPFRPLQNRFVHPPTTRGPPSDHTKNIRLAYISSDTLSKFNPLAHICLVDESISSFRDVWCTSSFLFYFRIKFLYTHNVDPDQTPCLWRLILVYTV